MKLNGQVCNDMKVKVFIWGDWLNPVGFFIDTTKQCLGQIQNIEAL